MRTIETLLHGLEHHGILERRVDVGVQRALLAYLVTHTPVQAACQT